jgi:hypothetical protein
VIALGSRARLIVLIGSSLSLVALGLLVEARGSFPLLRFGIQRTPELAPSTVVLPATELRRHVPTVSLYVSPDDLHDRKTGILRHRTEHGREWERPGWISFFEGSRLIYTSGVGVRVHGGGSRILSPRQGFRVFFRRAYGAKELPGGIAFQGEHAHPIRRLVIHNDARVDRWPLARIKWQLVNPLAYDIAAAAGGIVPATRPVRFFVNGTYYGVFVLTEHFDPEDYFETHWGHHVQLNADEFEDLWKTIQGIRPLRMDAVGQLVDLENFTRWTIATIFCATGDPYQGPSQFRDPTRSARQWFFVHWDMDQSFRDPEHDTFAGVFVRKTFIRRTNDPRAYLLERLLRDDTAYREYFKRVWVDVMNHSLTPVFLSERYDHYAALARDLGIEDLAYLTPLKQFLKARPAAVRAIAERRLNTPPSVKVTIAGSAGTVMVDGHLVSPGWEGYYFPGMRVRVSVPDTGRARVASWTVNGREIASPVLDVIADRDLAIEPIWRNQPPITDDAIPPTQ